MTKDFSYHSRKVRQLENTLKAIAIGDPDWNNSWTSHVITVIMKYLPQFYDIDSAINNLQERKKTDLAEQQRLMVECFPSLKDEIYDAEN